MAKVCMVNSYNYAAYLGECLRSVENQTVKFDKVIVVDDGSTDDSLAIARAACARNPHWELIAKENGGQLSCFNTAVSVIEATDLVFFLDADDLYPQDYLETASAHFDKNTDFLFCEAVRFNSKSDRPIASTALPGAAVVEIFCSSAVTRAVRSWVGSPTSAIAMRGSLLRRILPYHFESDWITRADDVLVYGSSIVGARKKYVRSMGVAYRVHDKNNFFRKAISRQEAVLRPIRLERLFKVMCERAELNYRASLFSLLIELEDIPWALHGRFCMLRGISDGLRVLGYFFALIRRVFL